MMKKVVARVLVFLVVACSTAFVINKINNAKLDEASRELEDSVLPLVYCEFEGTIINRMYGYTQTMATGLMRDGIVPLNGEHGVNVLVDDAQGYGSSFSYELRSIAGDSLIEEGTLEDSTDYQGYRRYKVNFRMDMRENQEYVLVFKIADAEGNLVRYYTRVVNLKEQYAQKIMDYASKFHNTTFTKEVNREEGNMVYDLIRTTSGGSSNLSHVDLTSSYEMISWGGIVPLVVTGIVPTITEIDNEYAVIHMAYVVESLNDSASHYYNVDEYYAATYDRSSETVNLLAYDRYIESIFDEGYVSKAKNCISMGIADVGNVEYAVSSDNRKLSFVKEGQLWCYDYATSRLVNVFGFLQGNYSDARAMNRNVDINILDMDDDGNIYFVVYGYMSRGKHEGHNGILLYYYTAEDARIQEKFFVECDEPFDVMKQETGRFAHYDETGYFYYLLDGTIFKVDLNNMTQDTLVYGIPSEKYVVSDNRKVVAYPDSAVEVEVTGIVVHNFETGEIYVEQGTGDDRLLALGFVNNDLIYGVADKNDITISSAGEAILPLYKLYIISSNGEVLKEYDKTGIYIMDARVQEDTIYLQRATKQNNFFEDSEADFISYKKDEQKDSLTVKNNYDDMEISCMDIVFPSNMYISASVKPIMTKSRQEETYTEQKVKTSVSSDTFYVFNNSGYKGEYNSAGRAILATTEEKAGLVVDGNGNTVYRAIAAASYNTIADEIKEYPCSGIEDSMMTCAYMCIEYENRAIEYSDIMACDSWEQAFQKYTLGVGVNISGISLNTALYFLDRDVPFAACIDDGRYVLVISYNSTHIRYYDPMRDEEVKVTRRGFEQSLSRQGNTMYTYTSQ